jgi:glycerophosphoryl diester phosphodiesterase
MPATPTLQPLIIGHRGAAAVAPENTIAAFNRALRDGADGIEFDVRLARDGVPVIIHDATLRRTALRPGTVSDVTGSELQRVDVGSWFNKKHPEAAQEEYEQETIPSLAQLFEAMAENDSLHYLEMKSDDAEVERLAAAVVKLINDFSFADRVIVESFHLPALQAVKEIDSRIRTAALFESRLRGPVAVLRSRKAVSLASDVGANEIALHHSLATRSLTDQAIQSDLPVVVWTVDNPVWIKRAKSRGVHALITNDPATMVRERSRLSVI